MFRNVDITIVALNRRTLKRHVFFQADEKSPSDASEPHTSIAFLPDVTFSGNSAMHRIDIAGARNWVMARSEGIVLFRFLRLQFYFKENDEFGLKLLNELVTCNGMRLPSLK